MRQISIAVLMIFILIRPDPAMAGTGYQGILLNPEKSIKTYTLLDQYGNNTRFPSANGKYQLAFFGYTSCPDICPTALLKIKQVMKSLKNRDNIEFYFISIDIDRDKPEQIKQYLEFFHPEIIGLTGHIRIVKNVEKEFGILTRKYQGKSALAYQLQHSVFMYLINPQGKLMLMYPGTITPTQLINDLNQLITSCTGAGC